MEWPLLAQSGRTKHRLRPVRDVLRDRNDLKLLTRCADFLPTALPIRSFELGYEGNRTGIRICFVYVAARTAGSRALADFLEQLELESPDRLSHHKRITTNVSAQRAAEAAG
jgi:hypothetical protein